MTEFADVAFHGAAYLVYDRLSIMFEFGNTVRLTSAMTMNSLASTPIIVAEYLIFPETNQPLMLLSPRVVVMQASEMLSFYQ
jgi:hypothetical protein